MAFCIEQGVINLPDPIIDSSTLSVSLDNQGMATLQISILTKSTTPITNSCCTCKFDGSTFKGFVQSDSPQRLEGTDYIEHTILARGMIC